MSPVVFHPESDASALVLRMLDELCRRAPGARAQSERLLGIGARLADAVDLFAVHADDELRRELAACGFVRVPHPDPGAHGRELWEHPRALLPLVELHSDAALRAFVRSDSVVDFLEAAPA